MIQQLCRVSHILQVNATATALSPALWFSLIAAHNDLLLQQLVSPSTARTTMWGIVETPKRLACLTRSSILVLNWLLSQFFSRWKCFCTILHQSFWDCCPTCACFATLVPHWKSSVRSSIFEGIFFFKQHLHRPCVMVENWYPELN